MVSVALFTMLQASCGLLAHPPVPAEPVRISLREAIGTALQNNLQVSIARQARESTRSGIQTREGAFDWNLSVTGETYHGQSPAPQPQVFGAEAPQNATLTKRSVNSQLTRQFGWGGLFELNYAPLYQTGSQTFYGGTDLNGACTQPYSGSLGAKYTQSLLRGLGASAELPTALVVAHKHADAADQKFQKEIIDLVATTETQYWDMVFAIRNLANKRTALELAQKLLKENAIRVQVGAMAPIEVTFAESQVAKAELDIITCEAEALNAQDTLIRALYPAAGRPAALEPTDAPTLSHIQLEEAAAIRMALARRVELKEARVGREIAKARESAAGNHARPKLDAYVAYSGASGNYGGLGAVHEDLAGFRNPGYTFGLTFAFPIRNREARGRRSAARADLLHQELRLRDQELSIALEVSKALRAVEAAAKGVKAAAKTRYFQEKNMDAEKQKFENGLSTNFTVLQVMTNLDSARNDELTSQIKYAKAVTAMEVAVGNLMEARNFSIR